MAQFFQVAGTQLVLPDYARTDLAIIGELQRSFLPAGSIFVYPIGGDYIEIPVSVFALFFTSAAVGNRRVQVQTLDGNGGLLTLLPASTTQAASTQAGYTFNAGSPFAYGPIGLVSVAGMPAAVLLPGTIFEIAVQGIDPADQFTYISLTTVKIPTGPQVVPAASSVATPVLA